MKIINTVAALTLTLLMASCGKEDKKVVADNAPAIPVTVAQVTANGSNVFLSASGKVQATNSADLSTRMMGFVNKVHVNVGDKVKKGQLLISINNADLQAKKAQVNASITEATAAFNNAEKDYNRFKSLFANNSASQKEMDDMTAHFEMAKARLNGAKEMENEVNAQFAYSNLRAPFDGVVTLKTVKEGDMANPGQPLISVESPGTFEVVAMVPETEISKIKNGTVVDVLVKSIDGTLKGKVTEVSASAKHTGGQYLVKIVLDATEANILSGMFATVQFPVEKQTKAQVVLVPLDAIVTNGQLTGIYTVSQSNTAILRWVRLGSTFGNQVEVLSGLSADEGYIVSAEGRLFNGAKVSVQ
ncbi:efflux RND transporter periplasmic adaptor subunit [Tamlana flava]|uniref:efflux RND transporter periplasmic adaptor subunit n=1 Tax=Tamlana flava TaxID=3158572 RepID=UPI00351B16BF